MGCPYSAAKKCCPTAYECCNLFTKKEEMEKNDDQHDHDNDDDCVDRDEL